MHLSCKRLLHNSVRGYWVHVFLHRKRAVVFWMVHESHVEIRWVLALWEEGLYVRRKCRHNFGKLSVVRINAQIQGSDLRSIQDALHITCNVVNRCWKINMQTVHYFFFRDHVRNFIIELHIHLKWRFLLRQKRLQSADGICGRVHGVEFMAWVRGSLDLRNSVIWSSIFGKSL